MDVSKDLKQGIVSYTPEHLGQQDVIPKELRDSYNQRELEIILIKIESKHLTCVLWRDPCYPREVGECLDYRKR